MSTPFPSLPLDTGVLSPYIPGMLAEQDFEELFFGAQPPTKKEIRVALCRPLVREDIVRLARREVPVRLDPIKKLRTSHHFLAKLDAEGRPVPEICAITGFTPNRLSILRSDPAYCELVEYYKTQLDVAYIDVHQRIAALSIDALEELHERVVDAPEKIKFEDLMKLASGLLDRSGHGPTVNHKIGVAVFTDQALEEIKRQAELRRAGTVRSISDDSGAPVSQPVRTAGPILEILPEPRRESEGPDLREEIRENAGTVLPGSGNDESVDGVP